MEERTMAQTFDTGPDHERVVTNSTAYTGDTEALQMKDRVRWGPILAGVLTTIASMIILTVLGLAIGLSAFEPNDVGEGTVSTAAAVWGAAIALISFFLGGWVAAKASAVAGAPSGGLNGFIVGAATIVLLLWMISTGLGNLLGSVGVNVSNIADIGNTVQNQAADVDAAQVAQNNYDEARNSAWGTLAGLVLPLLAAMLGGFVGHNERGDIVQSVGRPPAGGRTRSRA